MIFTLEVLQAQHGDSLILHYGDKDAPRFILVDGGPDRVYQENLRPRLESLRESFPDDDGRLPLQMVMVSHIDDDHINGVLAMTSELVGKKDDKQLLPYRIATLWHNSFDDVLGNGDQEMFSQLSGAAVSAAATGDVQLPDGQAVQSESVAVVASVPQGRQLREHADRLSIPRNARFDGLVMRQPAGSAPIDWGAGLQLTVVHPDARRIKRLHTKWEAALKEAKKKGDAKVLAAAYADTSVFNLSSIVVLAEFGAGGAGARNRMLLTGDARGDHILEGLEELGLFDGDGVLKVDVLKLPHHGSARNVEIDFFEKIVADRYVASANGRDDNPDIETLEMIDDARGGAAGGAEYTIYLTNRNGKNNLGARLDQFLAERPHMAGKLVFRDPDPLATLKLDLLDSVTY